MSRKQFLVGASTLAGGAVVEAVNLLSPKEKEPEKLVGGVWVDIKQGQEVPAEFIVKFQAQQRGSAVVHHVTLTASPNTAPNVPRDPKDIEQNQGPWHKLDQVMPGQNGMCEFPVDLAALGAQKGEVVFSTNVYGTLKDSGYQTSQTINYAPNGELHLKYI